MKNIGVIHPQADATVDAHAFKDHIMNDLYSNLDSEALHLPIKWKSVGG